MRPQRALLPVVALLLLVGVGAAFLLVGEDDDPAREGRLEVTGGAAFVSHESEELTVEADRNLTAGDRVRLGSGSARLFLPDGGILELRSDTQIFVDRGPELVSGALLVVADESPVTVRAVGSSLTVRRGGAAEAIADLGLHVSVFRAAADVGSAGRDLHVPAFRSTQVPAVGLVPGLPVPLVLDPADPWHQRYLAAAIDASQPLEDLARGFSSQLPTSTRGTVAFYRQVLSGLDGEPSFEPASIGDRPSGETLLAAAIALVGARDSFALRYANALAFRADGAEWALVALDQQVVSLPRLVERIRTAAGQQPIALAATAPVQPRRSTDRTTRREAPPVTLARTDPPPSSSAPGAEVIALPRPEPTEGLLNPLLNPVLNLLGGLLSPLTSGSTSP